MRVFVLAQGVRLGGLGCITSLYVEPHAPLLHASFLFFVLAQGVRLGGLGCITSLYVEPHAPLLHASFLCDSLHDAFSVLLCQRNGPRATIPSSHR